MLLTPQCVGSSCLAGRNKHLTENGSSAFLWASWAVTGNTLYQQLLSDISWVSLGSAWAMPMPSLLWSFSKVNCVVRMWREKTTQKEKLGLAWLLIQTQQPPCYGLLNICTQGDMFCSRSKKSSDPGTVKAATELLLLPFLRRACW